MITVPSQCPKEGLDLTIVLFISLVISTHFKNIGVSNWNETLQMYIFIYKSWPSNPGASIRQNEAAKTNWRMWYLVSHISFIGRLMLHYVCLLFAVGRKRDGLAEGYLVRFWRFFNIRHLLRRVYCFEVSL